MPRRPLLVVLVLLRLHSLRLRKLRAPLRVTQTLLPLRLVKLQPPPRMQLMLRPQQKPPRVLLKMLRQLLLPVRQMLRLLRPTQLLLRLMPLNPKQTLKLQKVPLKALRAKQKKLRLLLKLQSKLL